MAKLPIEFRQAPATIATYDYIDYASGRGYKKFYLACAKDNSAASYFITDQSTYTSDFDVRSLSYTVGTTSFDLPFNTNSTIQGELYINTTLDTISSSNFSASFAFYHVDAAATETLLVTVTSAVYTAAGDTYLRRGIKATMPRTSFGVGEKLRIKATAIRDSGGGNPHIYLDPSSVTTKTETTTSIAIPTNTIVQLPFVVAI